jgi:hypothetical protein
MLGSDVLPKRRFYNSQTASYPRRRHSSSSSHFVGNMPVQIGYMNSVPRNANVSTNSVRFEVFTAVTMKTGVVWDVMPCVSSRKKRFGRT